MIGIPYHPWKCGALGCSTVDKRYGGTFGLLGRHHSTGNTSPYNLILGIYVSAVWVDETEKGEWMIGIETRRARASFYEFL